MNKLKIFLADLTHTYKALTNPFIPYGIGVISSYAQKIFGDKIEVRLFKYPEKLYEALNQEHCDILGCSTYVWNSSLAHWACSVAKRKNPNVITVLGGPDFAKDYDQKLEYFLKYNYVDIRVLLEGEIAFSNLIKLILDHGIANKNKIFKDKIEGCSYLHKNKSELVEVHTERVKLLDEIPSPYTTGLLDEFFDGKLIPVIQTTRGCPFSCNFCVESDKYYSKIKSFQTQYAVDELDYIGKKISKTPTVTNLQIADSNYGMYRRDKFMSEKILELQRNYNWPQGIDVSTGKHFKNVIDTTEMLMDTFDFSMSVQSMDADVLEEIGRKNITTEKYKEAGEMLRKKGRSTLSETIVPLPKETLKSFFKGIMELMDCKVSRISSTTVMFLHGTIYKDKKYVKKFGYTSKFRLINGQFGIYGGEKVFEFEEVGVATNTFSFEEYIETRKFSLLVEMLYSSQIFREVEYFLEDLKLSYYHYIYLVYQELKNAPQGIKDVIQSLVNQSINELKNDEESLINYYSEEHNFQKILSGDEGENVKYTHKALLLSKYQDVWLDFAFSCLKKFLTKNNAPIKEDFYDLVSFVKCKFDGVLDHSRSYVSFINSFNYDIIEWLNQKDRSKTLKEFNNKDKTKIKFIYNENQIKERATLFNKYKDNDTFSVTNVLVSVRPQHKIYRKYEHVDQNV